MVVDDLNKCYFVGDLRLHMCQVLFMEAVLDVAIPVGRKSPKCWDAVFR